MRTHWRTGTQGNTSSIRWAALAVIRRLPQLGQNPRLLHDYQLAGCEPATGYPTRAKLADLGLDWLAEQIPAAP